MRKNKYKQSFSQRDIRVYVTPDPNALVSPSSGSTALDPGSTSIQSLVTTTPFVETLQNMPGLAPSTGQAIGALAYKTPTSGPVALTTPSSTSVLESADLNLALANEFQDSAGEWASAIVPQTFGRFIKAFKASLETVPGGKELLSLIEKKFEKDNLTSHNIVQQLKDDNEIKTQLELVVLKSKDSDFVDLIDNFINVCEWSIRYGSKLENKGQYIQFERTRLRLVSRLNQISLINRQIEKILVAAKIPVSRSKEKELDFSSPISIKKVLERLPGPEYFLSAFSIGTSIEIGFHLIRITSAAEEESCGKFVLVKPIENQQQWHRLASLDVFQYVPLDTKSDTVEETIELVKQVQRKATPQDFEAEYLNQFSIYQRKLLNWFHNPIGFEKQPNKDMFPGSDRGALLKRLVEVAKNASDTKTPFLQRPSTGTHIHLEKIGPLVKPIIGPSIQLTVGDVKTFFLDTFLTSDGFPTLEQFERSSLLLLSQENFIHWISFLDAVCHTLVLDLEVLFTMPELKDFDLTNGLTKLDHIYEASEKAQSVYVKYLLLGSILDVLTTKYHFFDTPNAKRWKEEWLKELGSYIPSVQALGPPLTGFETTIIDLIDFKTTFQADYKAGVENWTKAKWSTIISLRAVFIETEFKSLKSSIDLSRQVDILKQDKENLQIQLAAMVKERQVLLSSNAPALAQCRKAYEDFYLQALREQQKKIVLLSSDRRQTISDDTLKEMFENILRLVSSTARQNANQLYEIGMLKSIMAQDEKREIQAPERQENLWIKGLFLTNNMLAGLATTTAKKNTKFHWPVLMGMVATQGALDWIQQPQKK